MPTAQAPVLRSARPCSWRTLASGTRRHPLPVRRDTGYTRGDEPALPSGRHFGRGLGSKANVETGYGNGGQTWAFRAHLWQVHGAAVDEHELAFAAAAAARHSRLGNVAGNPEGGREGGRKGREGGRQAISSTASLAGLEVPSTPLSIITHQHSPPPPHPPSPQRQHHHQRICHHHHQHHRCNRHTQHARWWRLRL